MSVAAYLGLLHRSEELLASSFSAVGSAHAAEADVFHTCSTLSSWSSSHVSQLSSLVSRFGEDTSLSPLAVSVPRSGGLGLLRDLQDLVALASFVQSSWTVVWDAAQGLRDRTLMEVASSCNDETSRQLAWLTTRLKQAAPQALLVPSS